MISKLAKKDYEKVRPLIKGMEYNLVMSAVLDVTSPGEIYVDEVADPRTAFLCTAEGYYLVGVASNAAFNQALNQLILTTIFVGDTVRDEETDFALYYHPGGWEDQMGVIFKGKYPLKEYRRHYACREVQVDWRDQVPPGFQLARVDREFLTKARLRNFSQVAGWINTNWNTVDEFLQMGRAFCLLHGEVIASWCIADCVSGDLCEVGIHTDPEYRRQGLGTLTAAACVADFLSSGYNAVGWHCSENNMGSRGVAENVGFELTHRYPIYYCYYDDAFQLAINGHFQLKEKNYLEALKWYDRAVQFEHAPAWADYEAACALALLADNQAAVGRLYQAVDRGWSQLEHTQNDEDLNNLHGSQDWKEFLHYFREQIDDKTGHQTI